MILGFWCNKKKTTRKMLIRKKKFSNQSPSTITPNFEKEKLVLMYFHFCKLHTSQNGIHILFNYNPLLL